MATSARPVRRAATTARALLLLSGLTGLSAWARYRVRTARRSAAAPPSPVTSTRGSVDLSRWDPTSPPVTAVKWDIGTGVSGCVWRAPQARAVVLFLHGWGDYAERMAASRDDLVPALLAAGFNVYSFDMWGCGRSPGRRGLVDVEQAVADHLAARHRLREQSLPVFAVGHSLGGLVTATSVLADQTSIAGMVLLAPAIKYDVGGLLRLVVRVGALLAPTLRAPLPPGDTAALSSVPEALQRLQADPVLTLDGVTWLTAAGGATVSHRNWHRYARITVPVLAVHGTDDTSTDPGGSRDLIAAVASPDATLHLVPGGRHSLLDDADRQHTQRTLLDWLDERVPPPGDTGTRHRPRPGSD